MDASEEFIVVEEKESAEQETVSRLKTLIDLFTKSLDAVNESNILLRDELRSALSVTLQYCPSDGTINTEEIVKALDENVTGVDEVRSKYIRHLCSKLVAVDSEMKALQTQNEALKTSLELTEKQNAEQLKSLYTTVQTLEAITKRYEDFSRFKMDDLKDVSNKSPEILEDEETHSANLTSLCRNLASICDRLDKLHFDDLQIMNLQPKTCDVCVQAELEPDPVVASQTTVSTQATYCPARENTGTSTSSPAPCCETTDDVPTGPAPPYPTTDDVPTGPAPPYPTVSVKFMDHLNEVNRISSSVLPTLGARLHKLIQTVATSPLANPMADNSPTQAQTSERQVAQEPSFHAHDEEPWCPACSQRFASRTDLEEHLPLCLE